LSDDKITLSGKVLEICRGGQFRCEVQVGDTPHTMMAHASGKIRKFAIRIVAGDSVDIELSPYDLTRGRIVYRDRK
jgi:translation initiation factor IF-1